MGSKLLQLSFEKLVLVVCYRLLIQYQDVRDVVVVDLDQIS